ncbi:hypothetical protein, variant [Aphanomyces astaci]|uniref:C2 domain-containing protein n=1 Tax=Aphanomyces astaci TaxID=112090 RepID=W4GF56_APHAT|nr:hypothetical protein, variant [Aphanomyces astaci]ETV77573.1 hypothetical protein, variant [Aphanomyces astaci]|eukprot:XP_009832683.1 hypothetical protein, variant [Aphanomyces astaci]
MSDEEEKDAAAVAAVLPSTTRGVQPRQPLSIHIHDTSNSLSRRATISTVSSRIPVLRCTSPPKMTLHPQSKQLSFKEQDEKLVDSTTTESAVLFEILQGADPVSVECLEIGRSITSDVVKPSLWKLKSLDTLSSLTNVVTLDVSGHSIYTMDGLDLFVHLQHLNLARNNIKVLKLPKPCVLETLDVSGNYISHIPKSIQQLTRLQCLNLSGNGLAVLKQVEILAPLINLHTLHLCANPLSVLQSYRDYVVFTLLALSTLDGQPITVDQRERSRRRFTGPLPHDEIRRESDRLIHQDQLELEEKQDLLEAENARLKTELHVKSQLLDNKSKEWSSATHQLLQVEQELAMIHIDRNLPDSPTHQRYSALHDHVNHHLGHPNTTHKDGTCADQHSSALSSTPAGAFDGNALRLVHQVSVLRQNQDSMRAERSDVAAEATAIRNEIVLLDNEISVLKQALVGEQHTHTSSMEQTRDDPTYFYDDGRARLEELQTQIAFADVEASELEQRLVQKTKEMLVADLRVSSATAPPRHPRDGRGHERQRMVGVFDKEISALSYKLERMTTQKAEWVDELHKLQTSTQLPVLRLKQVEKHCPTSPRDALRKTFRKCEDTAAIPPETSLFTMLVSEKLAHLQALQQRRLDLVDMLMTREATLQALEDHLARIDKELADIGHTPTSDPTHNNNQSPSTANPFALTSPQAILDHLKQHVLAHVSTELSKKDDQPSSSSPNASPSRRSPLHRNSAEKPTNPYYAYVPNYHIVPGVDLMSANYTLLSSATGPFAFDVHTRLLLACKKLQQTERTTLIDATTYMDMDPQSTTNRLASRLEVTLIAATNLPRTRRLHSTCDPYVLLHLEHQNIESGQWERYHPTNAYRSNTKPNTLYPLWEEPFVFTPIESMSTRVCITVMDDKKTADRHEKLGDTSIELRSLLDQKRRVAWYPLSPAQSKDRPQPAVRLRLRFLYNKADRLRRAVDRLVAEFTAERHDLPWFLTLSTDPITSGESTQVPSEPSEPPFETSTSTKPPFRLDFKQDATIPSSPFTLSSQQEVLASHGPTRTGRPKLEQPMDAYREIFQARKMYPKVKAKRIDALTETVHTIRTAWPMSSKLCQLTLRSSDNHHRLLGTQLKPFPTDISALQQINRRDSNKCLGK